ncbi:hypothetical protein [Streptomyces sp. NRRL F-5123]|uniref:hypothetical protein n=1 Tax=Streptomyces sp. NRRL F-5123 TaxID=1463856 RepID=UPI0004E1681E|nr:hypothetical protein [Streptomyces sp. NRRL F-5123]
MVVGQRRPPPVREQDDLTRSVHAPGGPAAEEVFQRLVAACIAHHVPDDVVGMLRKADAATEPIVLGCGTPQEPVAEVSLSAKGATAFRNWGVALEPYRGRRLSRFCRRVAVRRSHEPGAATVAGVTRSPRLTSPDRPRAGLRVCSHRAPGGTPDRVRRLGPGALGLPAVRPARTAAAARSPSWWTEEWEWTGRGRTSAVDMPRNWSWSPLTVAASAGVCR